jgi:hypothetical protein
MVQTTGSKTAADRVAESTTAGNGDDVAQPDRLGQRPVYFKVSKKGKRAGKRKYSRGLKEPQRQEISATRAANRLADAVADGLSTYRKRRNRSADKKRDGAIKDAVRNTGRGLGKAIRTSAKVPTDLTRRAKLRRLRRMVPLPPPFGFLR